MNVIGKASHVTGIWKKNTQNLLHIHNNDNKADI